VPRFPFVPASPLFPSLWAGVFTAAWIAAGLYGLWAALRFRTLRQWDPPEPASWPRLSVIVAACDEGETIGPALRTLLASDYPDFEVVVVDDRSKDATGSILDAAAASDSRLRAVHVTELPDGWLGKVHAMHRGIAAADGAFLLFTDADVHFEPGAMRRAVAHAVAHGIDHVVVAPELLARGIVQDALSAAFVTSFLVGTRAVEVDRPGSKVYVGVGAFNLVRREAFDRTPGLTWLRLEVLDDVGLGLMMRRAGAKTSFAIGLGDVTIVWYETLRAMAGGLDKNMFGAVCRYSLFRLAAFLAGAALFLPAPLLALAVGPRPWMPLAGVSALGLALIDAAILAVRTRRSILPFVLAPAGGVLFAGLVVRSAWRCMRRGGIVWRGTFYPLDALRAGQRVKL
jgi:Glycosyl transferase family 2